MERRKQNEKGITLVALVITIIVLVILVGVSVSTALNTGLIGNSKNAVAQYDVAQKNETSYLDDVLDEIDSAKSTWKQNGTEITDGKGHDFVVGQKVTYNQTSNTTASVTKEDSGVINNPNESGEDQTITRKTLEWQILGVNEKGKILLISTEEAENILFYEGGEGVMKTLDRVYNELYGESNLNTKAFSLTAKIMEFFAETELADVDMWVTNNAYLVGPDVNPNFPDGFLFAQMCRFESPYYEHFGEPLISCSNYEVELTGSGSPFATRVVVELGVDNLPAKVTEN